MAPLLLDRLPSLTSPLGIVLVVLVTVFVLYSVENLIHVPYPPGIPLIREPEGTRRFSLRTRYAYLTDCQALFREAYHDYIKKGKPVVIPGFGFRKEVILPQSSMKWVLSQPDEVLNVTKAFAEVNQVRWSLGHEKIAVDAWQGMLVKSDLNRVLENIVNAMNNELKTVFDEQFGKDTENWREIDLRSTIQIIVAQAASRFTVGLPLCRNKDYLKTSLKINDLLILNAGLTGGLPLVLQPIVGTLLSIPTGIQFRKLKKWFVPLWKGRMEADPSVPEPQDHLQMMLRYGQRERPDEINDMDVMTGRLIAHNFGSMHQTQIQVTNLILNVLGSDAEFNTIAVLRDEIDRILGPDEDAQWTKALVNQMTRADSLCRETLRLGAFGGRANFRKVMTSDFTTEDGIPLPKGLMISFLGQPAQTDEETMEDPLKFDPFRFSRMRELAVSRDEKVPLVSMVSTSPEFLPFGHGKHACPGRFLIDFELKMILAYMLRNYDIAFPKEYEGKRPPNVWMAEAVLPPEGVRIRIRRRTRQPSN
ncbi:hypothetical protein NCS57_01207500 [Fusarium keratoplasticum]|uniref:Uncharacterized protein n=1 Tax=Fusarium keratoplasticum TaxID=1328300 RepID=A0ACC0QH94_9HYPO|nr:hypothetical protein NCS57_01207500 [Fusarium keratoplasticum]KAI8654609.1 hypothetical protein NCS57_01207500 [Fusarium keratoplasticum]KAI8655469.1 hypothetical protein NCS55_01199000 [Fusarium keratoplasticum]